MTGTVAAVEAAVGLSGYRQAVLAWAPAIAVPDPGPRGVFLGLDFHITPQGPRLIEVNTNAGGAWVNAVAGPAAAALGAGFLAMFQAEWQRLAPGRPLRTVAIVDEEPQGQFLYPEFVGFRELFRGAGLAAVIAAPQELVWRAGRLWCGDLAVDLVYNRLTDFYLEASAHAALADAYRAGAVALTPHPHAHALYADKRNLALLGDRERLAAWGLPAAQADLLGTVVPRTTAVRPDHAEALWQERRRWFFKPACGFGSRGAYRGAKMTRRVWEAILADGGYVAQEWVPPDRLPAADGELSYDVRCYAYAGAVQLLAARLYRGQTTNFRTPGGGFALVCEMPQSPAAAVAGDLP